MTPTQYTLPVHGLHLHYVAWGKPDAPPLILLHGGRDHCRSWDWTALEFARDWRVIAPDLRGHGDSDWSPEGNYTLLALVHDFVRLAEHLNAWPLTIVAHSLGGNIALRYAGLYPDKVRRVVSIEGLGIPPKMLAERLALGTPQRIRNWISESAALAAKPTHRAYARFDEALVRMQEGNPNLSAEKVRHLTAHGVRQSAGGAFTWKFDPFVRPISPVDMAPEEVAQMWAAIKCPVLLCYGEDSWTSNPDEDGRARHFVDARVKLFPNAGHWLHHDQFELFIAELKAFL